MKKNFFAKSMSALLALIMVLSVMVVLPISATGTGGSGEPTQAMLIPYEYADSGDKLYTIDFRGDTAFTHADYLAGQNGGYAYKTNKSFTPSADGSELTIAGENTSGSDHCWWGGEIEGLEIPEGAFYTMVYKAKPLDSLDGNGESVGQNNSVAVGGWAYSPVESGIYVNYGNYNSETLPGEVRNDHTDCRRLRINASQTAIGETVKIEGGNVVGDAEKTYGGYTFFSDLANKNPLLDSDGYMTTMIEYDSANGKIYTYYLVSGTGENKSDWQAVQVAPFTPTVNDVIGYWMYCSYNIVHMSIKDVSYYKGTYYQNTPVIKIGTADELANLGTALADASLSAATTVRVQLTDDIDMTGKAYLPVSTTKVIKLNGNGYTISNLSVGTSTVPVQNAGLFATVGAGSTFRNLMLADVSIYGTEFTGALVANPVFGDLTATNVWVTGTVVDATPNTDTVPHVGFAGGLIGGNDYFEHTDDGTPDYEATWKLAYCVNAANVTAPTSAAGMVGAVCGAFNFDLDYCANMGDITTKGLGCENSDNQAAGLVNLRHHGYANGNLYSDGTFDNCFNTGTLKMEAKNSLTTYSGTGGILGIYRVLGDTTDYQNTLAFYNCFDYSKRDYPANVAGDENPSEHGAIAVWTSKTEIPLTTYTNCYGAPAPESPMPYGSLAGSNAGTTETINATVVESGTTKIDLTTGSSTVLDMISRLAEAITYMTEVDMPLGGFDDGKDRDYTWYYNEGNLVTDKGTEAAPYEISTVEQFAALSALTWGYQAPEAVGGSDAPVNFNGKYFKLTADIDLTGYQAGPLNMEDATVVFDGNGKKISNWSIDNVAQGGMFSALGKNSVVKNLTLDNVDVNGLDTSAVLIATAKAGLTVTNIKITDTCSVVTAGTIGASLVGSILDDEAAGSDESTGSAGDVVKISYCVNEADVTAREQVGGLVGKLKGVFNYQISYCVNKGDVTASRETGAAFYVGGIIAYTERGTQEKGSFHTFIESCYNVGKLTTADTNSYCYVGGIAGYLKATTGAEITIKNCYDASARKLSTACAEGRLKNGAIGGNADDSQLAKYIDYSYATNGEGSQAIVTTLVSWPSNNSIVDSNSKVVANLDSEIVNMSDEASTMRAEMAKIDTAIAEGSQIAKPTTPNEPGTPGTNNEPTGNTNESNTTTTTAPETTTAAPAEEKKGCGSALNSTYAVIALVAVLGFAFVAKKKEEN